MGPTVIFDAPITIQSQEMERYYVVADIASTSSGNTMGASIPHTGAVTLTSGVVTVERVAASLDVGYIEVIPSDIVIDGGFGDWLGMSLDSNDEPEPSLIQSIDIRSYDAANDNTSASFYLRVDEEVFGGTSVPYDTPTIPTGSGPVIIDSDRDSVPDTVDGPNGDGTRPFDFDNDGVSDIQTGYDYDGDGVTDYPFGTDEWLETTIPPSYLPAYANRTVRVFIGLRILPEILGEDIALIFIDTNESSGTGYAIGPVYAGYMIQIVGKNGNILSSELSRHSGTSPGQWQWSPLEPVVAETDYSQLEVQVPLESIGLGSGEGFGAYFYVHAWNQAGEDSSDDTLVNVTTRSLPESRTGHYADASGGHGLIAPHGDSIDDLSGGTQDSSKDGWLFSSPAEDTGTRASYQVDTSTSSEASAYSHQRKLIYDGTYWWAFCYNGTETVYEYSSDGETWSNTEQALFSTSGVKLVSVWYNSTGSSRIVYAVGDTETASVVVYVRRGTISGTTITWGTEYTVTVCNEPKEVESKSAFISQDGSGHLWIVSSQKESASSPFYNIAAVRSTSPDDVSSWGTYSLLLSTNHENMYIYPIVLPLSDQDVYAMWYRDGYIEGKKYTSGSGWGSVTSIDTTTSGVANKTVSAVVDTSYNIHLVYVNETGRVNYMKYTTSWSSPTVLDSSANNEYVTISTDNSTDYLYTFWVSSNYQIEGKKYTGSSWSNIDGIETNTNAKDWLTSVYNVSAVGDTCWEWTQGTSSPYDVRFERIPEFTEILIPFLTTCFVIFLSRRRKSVSRQRKQPSFL